MSRGGKRAAATGQQEAPASEQTSLLDDEPENQVDGIALDSGSPVVGVTANEPGVNEEPEAAESDLPTSNESEELDYSPPVVNPNISRDPNATVAAALIAVGRLYNDAGFVSEALSRHLRNTAGEPQLFAFLQRMQLVLGDFRHSVSQIEAGMSEQLRDAIELGVA